MNQGNKHESRASVARWAGIPSEIITACWISQAFNPLEIPPEEHPELLQFSALWDTGATKSAISRTVVASLRLESTGRVDIQSVNAKSRTPTYLVNVGLPNRVGIYGVDVIELMDLGHRFDAIIGMDIITQGDFVLTNAHNSSLFLFAAPSSGRLDVLQSAVNEYDKQVLLNLPMPISAPHKSYPRVGRNDPCPCGSGKKYTKCHGA